MMAKKLGISDIIWDAAPHKCGLPQMGVAGYSNYRYFAHNYSVNFYSPARGF
jgi:hypothetical protein